MRGIFQMIASLFTAAAVLLSGQTLPAAAAGQSSVGRLHVSGVNLVTSSGSTAVLHGMSTHGMQWYPQFASAGAFHTLKSRGANLVRLAMYTDEGGYISNPNVKNKVFQAADAAIAQNMYVIIDWHILHDGNPMTHKDQAISFFREASSRFADNPAVLYEICNEPNGNVNWSRDIKPYAQQVIPVIRAKSPNAVVLVGTPTWSQDVDTASADKLNFSNVMYAFHFYAGTHGQNLRDKVDTARKNGAAVFVSEWGTTDASGGGNPYLDASRTWMNFMKARSLSWANWSLCDKSEGSAALKSGASANGGWTDANLTTSGKFVFDNFSGATSAPTGPLTGLTAQVTLNNGTVRTVTASDTLTIPTSSILHIRFTGSGGPLNYTAGSGNVIQTGTVSSWNGSTGHYTAYAHGAEGQGSGLYVNGKLLFKLQLTSRPLSTDTSVDMHVSTGCAYTFRVTPKAAGHFTFMTANGSLLQTSIVPGSYPASNGNYYCRVKIARWYPGNIGVYCNIDGVDYKLFSVACQ